MRTLLIVAAALMLAACEPTQGIKNQRQMSVDAMQVKSSERVNVKLIGKFEDELAYGNIRGIYVIHDSQTGAEFIGISGIGITEVGDHRSGKVHYSDER